MLKKGLAVLALAIFAAPLFADVELSTSISDVFHQGTNELAGSITMRVNDDDFNDASTSTPVYIRLRLDNRGRLAETLVDQNYVDTSAAIVHADLIPVTEPIFLAMQLNTGPFSSQILTAPSETVSVVRWVAGESELWIRVQSSSETWIEDNGIPLPPDQNITVSWTIGISARASSDKLDGVNAARINLPFNTRDVLTTGDDEDAVSTLLCVDLLGSDLEVDELLEYDAISFDFTAELSPGVYGNGRIAGVNFTNDFRIARGKARLCTVTIADKGAFVVRDLCIPAAGANDDLQGFITVVNSIEYIIDCETGGDYLPSPLLNGAYWYFSTGSRAPYGFHPDVEPYFSDSDAPSTPSGNTFFPSGARFNNHGDPDFYSAVILEWNGGPQTTNRFNVTVTVPLRYHYLDGPATIDLDYEIVMVNNTTAHDVLPFDGHDQHAFCEPSEFTIAEGLWNYGAFVECTGVNAVLFFPYMPKLKDDALFWSGLSVVNQGGIDLDVNANIYDENGNLFQADFPELKIRNQYTWLLIDNPELGQTGFFGMGDYDGTVIVPAPANPAVPAESFGETRMSMFVIGSFGATFTSQKYLGDLDGYLLIGKGGDIDGSYLPRNYDNDIPNQNQDLPLWRSKNGKQIVTDRTNASVVNTPIVVRPALEKSNSVLFN
jgi:hypothetical protein